MRGHQQQHHPFIPSHFDMEDIHHHHHHHHQQQHVYQGKLVDCFLILLFGFITGSSGT
jgi:hypothetical protein